MQRPFPAYQGDEPYVFVSYAHKDAALVYPLLTSLHEAGVKLWYDEGIEPGSQWRDELAGAIDRCSSLLFFASATSVASSNCKKEIGYALDRGKRVSVAYLEEAKLPQGLEFGLGDMQAIRASHYDPQQFANKLQVLVQANNINVASTKSSPGSTKRPKLKRLSVLLVSLCLLAAAGFLFQKFGAWDGEEQSIPSGPPVIALAEFRNLTDNAANDWLGDGLTHLVRDKLSLSRHLQVVSDARWSGVKLDAGNKDLLATARRSGVGYLVSGEILGSPQGLVLSTRTTHLDTGVDIASRSFRGLTPETLINQAEQLASAVLQGLKIPREAQVDSLAADFKVTNLSAYEAYIAGLQYYNAFSYKEAEAAMQAALQLEPTYVMAAYRAANIQASAGRLAEARETLLSLPENASKTPRESAYIEGLEALLAEDNAQAIKIYLQLLQQYPYEIEAQQFLAEAYYRNYEDEKGIEVLEALSRQEPENLHVWASLGFMLSSVERLDEARDALTRYQQLAPTLPNAWELLGSLEMKVGNVEQAEAHFAKAISIDPNFSRAQQGQARLEITNGEFTLAQPRLEAIVADEAKPARERVEAAFDLVALHQARANYSEVSEPLALVEPLLEEWVTLARSEEGLAALRMGDVEAAEAKFRKALEYEFPGYRPTRFLFCLGLAQISNRDFELLTATLRELANLPVDEAGGNLEKKAIAYLLGLSALQQGNYAEALQNFRIATDESGFEYRIYRNGLAETLFRMGELDDALVEADRAGASALASWSGEPRLDLEVDRRMAQAMAIMILKAKGEHAQVIERQERFRSRWGSTADTASVIFRLKG